MAKTPYQIAQSMIGLKEYENGVLNPMIKNFFICTTVGATSENLPWCSAFVNYCFIKAGVKGTRLANARSWLKWGQPSEDPKEGDIVVLRRGSDEIQGHVAFLVCFDGPYVMTLGGNQNNSVCISKYPIKSILDIRTYPI